jgi:hypothetical protein
LIGFRLSLGAITVLILSCMGCYPLYIQINPGVEGRVIDGENDVPVQGAEATLSRGDDKITVLTGEDGRFSIPPRGYWQLSIIFMENFPMPIPLTVRPNKCETPFERVFDLSIWSGAESLVQIGDLRFKCTR